MQLRVDIGCAIKSWSQYSERQLRSLSYIDPAWLLGSGVTSDATRARSFLKSYLHTAILAHIKSPILLHKLMTWDLFEAIYGGDGVCSCCSFFNLVPQITT